MFRHREMYFAVNRLVYIFEYPVQHCLTCTQNAGYDLDNLPPRETL